MRARACDLLGITYPIIQAGMGSFTSAELVAAASSAGILGSLGSANRPPQALREEIARTRSRTDRPFAVNFLVTDLPEETFAVALAERVPVISFALADPGDLVERAHDAAALVIHQVHSRRQAAEAAAHGVDLLIAQGGEAGGFGQLVSTMALVPQVVDEVRPLPVMAAGGIADGRGIAAALMLGAEGVNIGTRFLASLEAPIPNTWKEAILGAESEDAVKADFFNLLVPQLGGTGYGAVPRVLRTPFTEAWRGKVAPSEGEVARGRDELLAALGAGRFGDYVPFSGQSAGLIHDMPPVAEIVRRLMDETEAALSRAAALLGRA